VGSQATDFAHEFKPENLSRKSHLCFERVNEATFKLTDGECTDVPTSHGQWGGYRTTKAVAWVINKANALAMARGACGDYFIENPVEHLNGLKAQLEDRQNNEPPAAGTTSGSKSGENRRWQ
jgi:hypothetical protein